MKTHDNSSSWPSYTQREIDAVRNVLCSNRVNYWTGEQCQLFEKEFASWVGCNYAVAMANGTVALDAALRSLGIGSGDEVIVTARTYIATVSSVINAGADPVFADVDRNTQNITAKSIEKVLTKKTKAIICVHLAGLPCDMDPIMALANIKGLFVIEDCAQAHGALYKGRSVGGLGHIGAWSFCQDKIMTTGGEGGMVTTNDKRLWSNMWAYKDHGKDWSAVKSQVHPPGFRWVHHSFGTNARMTELQAAIGRVQIEYMRESWHQKRLANAERIWKMAKRFPVLRVPDQPQYTVHAAYKCYVFVKLERLKPRWDRDRVMAEITKMGVPCYTGICSEVYLEKAFEGTGLRPKKRLPVAKELGETSLMFLVHPTLTDREMDNTISAIITVMRRCSSVRVPESDLLSLT